MERGFTAPDGLLVVLDGAKGLRAAVQTVFGARAQVQRCQWHKRENVVRYLPTTQQGEWRRKLQAAYERPTYEAAKAALTRLHRELRRLNASAAASLLEGLEETLTLHRHGVFTPMVRHQTPTSMIDDATNHLRTVETNFSGWVESFPASW